MEWRYWITYSAPFQTESDDEDVAIIAAAELHAALLAGDTIYLPSVEVEQVEGRENE